MTGIPSGLSDLLVREEEDVPAARRSGRDWWIDSVLFLLAIVFGTVSLVHSYDHGLRGALFVIDLTCGVVLCLALWGRRRWPIALGLASVPVMPISSFAGPAGAIILYTVAAYRRWQLAVLVAAGQLALLPAERAIHPQGNSVATYYLTGILGTAAVVAWGMFRRGRLQTHRERQRRTEAEEQLRVEQIRHAERERIAREMHDVLAHRISLLSLHAGALEFHPDAPPDEIARAAAVIRASAHQALEDLRSVIGVLRHRAVDEEPQPPQPTLAALPDLLEESRAAGMRLNSDVRVADTGAVPDAVGRHALRIVQEALTNSRKHAGSAPVDLRIEGAPGEGLTIEVRNPAPVLAGGATQIPGSGAGLVGLAERAALSGGRLEHGLDARGDFRLRAWLPWSS
ncbi:MAG: sensor histidine kinase [Solirubrobacterales bacterium]|nr:sensor histidine kinase [Solirubrobacterales bacterium]